jgi:hypothetical protein
MTKITHLSPAEVIELNDFGAHVMAFFSREYPMRRYPTDAGSAYDKGHLNPAEVLEINTFGEHVMKVFEPA